MPAQLAVLMLTISIMYVYFLFMNWLLNSILGRFHDWYWERKLRKHFPNASFDEIQAWRDHEKD